MVVKGRKNGEIKQWGRSGTERSKTKKKVNMARRTEKRFSV